MIILSWIVVIISFIMLILMFIIDIFNINIDFYASRLGRNLVLVLLWIYIVILIYSLLFIIKYLLT